MGVEHYIVCRQCKEYIGLHKAYEFAHVIRANRPGVGFDCKETGFSDSKLKGTYWESRGLWFLWHHRGHSEIELWTDYSEEWFNLEPYLKEVFSHNEDIKIREREKKESRDE